MTQKFVYKMGCGFAKAREKRNLSQMTLGALAEISENTISRIETGQANPSLNTLLKLCKVLDYSLAQIINEAEYEPLIRSPELRELVDLLNSQDKETIKYILGITKTMISLKKQSK